MSKTAIVHDWLPVLGGAEHVVKDMLLATGSRDLFTLFDFLSPQDRAYFGEVDIHSSPLNSLPGVEKYYRYLIMACARAIEGFDMRGFDTIVSSSACFAKGVITSADQRHVAYVHSPPRYAWDLTHEYLDDAKGILGLKRLIAARAFHKLRMWDLRTIHGMDQILANSRYIQRRIKKVYGRDSEVVYPPVDTAFFSSYAQSNKEDYYVTACRLVGYKRVDILVQAFADMPNKKLIVIGDGPERSGLQLKATPNVEFLGHADRAFLGETFANAKAFLYGALEDFGIVPLEAQATGTPVIAYGAGGALETVRGLDQDAPTGVHFPHQTATAVRDAVEMFEANQDKISAQACMQNADAFNRDVFQSAFSKYVS